MKRLLSEPLILFVLLGVVLFGAQGLLGGRFLAATDGPFVVDAQLAEWIASSEARSRGRKSTVVELQGAVHRYARMEALRREARRLGLDEGDPIVERRLEQKMEFLLEGAPADPSDEELMGWFVAHRQDYAREPIVALEHRFWSGDWAHERAEAGKPAAPFVGGPTARGTVSQLDARFGPGFGEQVFAVQGEHWSPVITSSYGLHRVRITERVPASVPELSDVKERVRRDLLADGAQRERERRIDELVRAMQVQITADLSAAAAAASP